MGWKKALLHAGIAAGSAFFAGLSMALADGRVDLLNLTVAGVATGAALFASLTASYAAGELDDATG